MKNIAEFNLVVVLGPTASGKTGLAARLARDMRSEVISADSRQVYRGMNIGTGKDLDAYQVDGEDVPYHLIDVAEPSQEFSVFAYQTFFFKVFKLLREKGIVPVLAGGTGMYIDSVLRGYRMSEAPENPALRQELQRESRDQLIHRLRAMRPALHNTTDLTDRERLIRAIEIARANLEASAGLEAPGIRPFILGVHWDRDILRKRITARLRERLEKGLVSEVEGLRDRGLSWERMEELGLEYRYASRYLRGMITFEEMFQDLNTKIHQYAKRQLTWFRRMERQGMTICWIDGDDYPRARDLVGKALGREI